MYVVHFSVAGIVITLLSLTIYYSQKAVPDSRGRRFSGIIWLVLGSTVFDTVSTIFINLLPAISPMWVIGTTTVYYLFHNSIPPLVAMYVLYAAGEYPKKRPFRILLTLPWSVSLFLIVVNIGTGILFSVQEVNGIAAYRHGPFMPALYTVGGIYFFISFVAIFSRRSEIPARHSKYYNVALLVPIGAIIFQNIFRGLILESFSASMSILFILFTIQNAREFRDGQTGLYNRDAFIDLLHLSYREEREFSFLVVYSREMGELQGLFDIETSMAIVNAYSSWLREQAGKGAFCCILNDGLFAVLPPLKKSERWTDTLANDITARSSHPWTIGPLQIDIPVNVAIYRSASSPPDPAELLEHIERTARRSHYTRSDSDVKIDNEILTAHRQRTSHEEIIFDHLQRFISDRDVDLVFLPVYGTAQKRITTLDTSVCIPVPIGHYQPSRSQSMGPGLSLIDRQELVRTVQAFGRGAELNRLLIQRACLWFVDNDMRSYGIGELRLPLFPSFCVEPHWTENILGIIAELHMPPDHVCLEITERTVVEGGEHLRRQMGHLTAAGIRFALGSYGSDYTNFEQILEMPFSEVNIDKKIVHAGLGTPRGRSVLRGTVSLFKNLGRSLTAEGVDNLIQAEALAKERIDFLLGSHIGPPQGSDEILGFLTRKRRAFR